MVSVPYISPRLPKNELTPISPDFPKRSRTIDPSCRGGILGDETPMSFRLFIYYCTLCGGCAAFLGWVLGRLVPFESRLAETGVKGLFLGLTVAFGLSVVDAVWTSGRVFQV